MHKQNFTPSETIGVQCEVNIASSVSFQPTTLYAGNTASDTDEPASIHREPLSQDCRPQTASGSTLELTDILTDHALATMAGASWQLLRENFYDDGWPTTLFQVAANSATNITHRNFKDSKNGFWDALGLASAIAMGNYYGIGHGIPGRRALDIVGSEREERIASIGPEAKAVLLLCMPLALYVGLLVYMMKKKNY